MIADRPQRRQTCVAALASLLAAASMLPGQGRAQQGNTLTGHVSSAQEGPMEGVVVSARRVGGTETVSVVSDAQGAFRFPAGRLAAGRYELAIRASGYTLDSVGRIDLDQGGTATADLLLRQSPVTPELITNAEWLASAPGTDDIKRHLLNCTDCHSLQRVFQSQHTKAEFLDVFKRMGGYYPGASDAQPQRLLDGDARPPLPSGVEAQVAEYLASVNLNGRESQPFAVHTFPRPAGRATRVVITEYDLSRPEIQPHDVIVDNDGIVWFGHFGEQLLTRLDPRTGDTRDYPIPLQRPGSPVGTLDIEQDREGNIWVGLMYQTGLARFDRATGFFRIFPLPRDWLRPNTQQSHFSVAGAAADGKAWVKDSNQSQIMRLDIATGAYENFGSQRVPATNAPVGIYGIYADARNNAYVLEFPFGGIGRLDTRSGTFKFFPTPTANARARRGRVDGQDRLWFAEYGGNAIAMLDPITERITEWRMPLPWEAPYDVVAARNGEVWEVNESSDRVGRLNPATGEIVNYLLPRPGANVRRVFVDDRADRVAVWFGSNHGASVIKVEPLD